MEKQQLPHTELLALAQLRVGALISVIEEPGRIPGVGPHILDEAKRRALANMGLGEATE